MTVATHLFLDIMLKFGFPRILHSDNGMESLPATWHNRRLIIPHATHRLTENWNLHKDCICTFSIDGVLEWDHLLPYATAAFNWFPNEHSQESPHFLCFGFDPYLPHQAAFLQPKLRCLGLDRGMISLDKLTQAYLLTASNTNKGQSKQSKGKYDDILHYKIGDLVMIRNFHKKSNWVAKDYLISELYA